MAEPASEPESGAIPSVVVPSGAAAGSSSSAVRARLVRLGGAGGEAPPDLLLETRRRLGFFALVTCVMALVSTLLPSLVDGMPMNAIPPAVRYGVTLTFAAYAGFVAWRALTERIAPSRVLDFALAYQVLGCTLAAVLSNAAPWPTDLTMPMWSPVAVFTLLAPIVIPTTTPRAICAAVLSMATDPIAMLVAVRAGTLEMPTNAMMFLRFAPEVLAVPAAVIIARTVHRLGERLNRAQDMGSYRLIELLGEGGMGEVWRATHRFLRREAAVKIIRFGHASEPQREAARARFEREATTIAELRSPHTVQLYDYGTATDGTLYFVMEMLHGETLEKLVREHGPMPPERVVFVLEQIAASLREAHEHGLVHRDVKPANLIIGRYGGLPDFVKVLDFGLVRDERRDVQLTHDDAITGTPAYLSPEEALGEPIGPHGDLYAIGCVGYFLLTGKLVFEAKNPVEMAVAHAVKQPEPPSRRTDRPIPPELDALILKLLAKSPADRHPSAHALQQALTAMRFEHPWTEERAAAWWAEHVHARAASTPEGVGSAA